MILCVTGTMAAGKNVASNILSTMGFASIDCDCLVHSVLKLDYIKQKIKILFEEKASKNGIILFDADGSVNRRALGKLLFNNSTLLSYHEKLIHPCIETLCHNFIIEHPNTDIVLNATVLYKLNIVKECNAIIYIDCPMFLRLIRAKIRDKMSIKLILQRFVSQRQLFAKYKEKNADIYRVWNIGSKAYLQKKLAITLEQIARMGIAHYGRTNIK